MNYLGLVGLLGLTGEADGPPMQAAGQIADLGGGALMAAFGILAALRERDRSGEGQLVDVSMADGALSWLAMVAARTSPTGTCRERGGLELAGAYVCYRPYRASDGWVTPRRAGAEVLAGVVPGRRTRGSDREPVRRPGIGRPRGGGACVHGSHTRRVERFASEHDCCLEPVLELDEALDSELVRAREMVVELDQPGAERPVRLLGTPVKLSRTPGDPSRPARRSASTPREVLAGLGYGEEEIAALEEYGAVAGPAGGPQGSFMA